MREMQQYHTAALFFMAFTVTQSDLQHSDFDVSLWVYVSASVCLCVCVCVCTRDYLCARARACVFTHTGTRAGLFG